MVEDGKLVGRGGFRVDRRRALEVLRARQLPEGYWVPRLWLRLAAACGARRVRMSGLLPAGARIEFDGDPLSCRLLQDPFGRLAAGEGSAKEQWLGWALLHSLPPGAEVRIASGLGTARAATRYKGDGEGRREAPDDGDQTVVDVRSGAAADWFSKIRPADAALASADAVPFRLETPLGSLVPWERRREAGALRLAEMGRRLRARMGASPSLRLFHWGVAAHAEELTDFPLPVEAGVDDPALTLDASLDSALEDDAFARAVAAGRRAAERFALAWLKRHGRSMRLAGELVAGSAARQALWSRPAMRRLTRLLHPASPPSGDDLRVVRAAQDCALLRRAAMTGLRSPRIDSNDTVRAALWRAPLLFAYGGRPLALLDLGLDGCGPEAWERSGPPPGTPGPRVWELARSDAEFLRDFPKRPCRLG